MTEHKFDPELLQTRWVLGGVRSEDLPDQAARALEEGFDGTALRQLAGLVRPTLRELGNLPSKAFGEMALGDLDKDQAAAFLIARGLPPVSSNISLLLKAFPGFSGRWKRHVTNWSGESAGAYNDMEQFVQFVVDDLYEAGDRAETSRFFSVLEQILAGADEETKNLIALGFFERLHNYASGRAYGSRVFDGFLGPRSKQMWNDLQATWAGNRP